MTAEQIIPPITDPLGQYWEQPARSAILADETHALMRSAHAAALHNYDSTFPTGVYPGKMWRRREPFWRPVGTTPERDLLVWYGEDVDGQCEICFRELLLTD